VTIREPKAKREYTAPRGDRVTVAYQRLRDLIVWGRLAPGSRIVESEVAVRLGVSRTPVRSALHRLQQEGYILAEEGGRQLRLRVAPLTIDDARDLFAILGRVEGLAARRAAELPPDKRLPLVRRLRQCNDELLAAVGAVSPDSNLIYLLDVAFHRQYVAAVDAPRLVTLHDAIKPQAERYNRLYATFLLDEVRTSVDEHERIVRSIEAANVEQAELAARANFVNAAERLRGVIERLGERGIW
jgi:DNA-binding GntR family transcriptional regulator